MDILTTRTLTRIFWIIINLSYPTNALRDVYATIPPAVRRGDNALLTCHYDLEQENLYSVKWYKGNREFYRYTPREVPPVNFFPGHGILIEKSKSNLSNVMLATVEPQMSGRYSCEVSADAPWFHTSITSGDLEVVDVQKGGPVIEGLTKIYEMGQNLTLNCSISSTSSSPANLTWLVNNKTVAPSNIVQYRLPVKHNGSIKLATAVLGLRLLLAPEQFDNRKLTLACAARIYNLFDHTTEKQIELDATDTPVLVEDLISTTEQSNQMFLNEHSKVVTYNYNHIYKSLNRGGNDIDLTTDDFQIHHAAADTSPTSSPSTSSSSTLKFRSIAFPKSQILSIICHLGIHLTFTLSVLQVIATSPSRISSTRNSISGVFNIIDSIL